VARLAQALQVLLIPEQLLIAMVRPLVVGYELRCVRLDLPTSDHLAGEEIASEDGHTQLLPARLLVPTAMLKVLVTLTMAFPLIIRQATDPRRKGG
jgi:hypothetical protein